MLILFLLWLILVKKCFQYLLNHKTGRKGEGSGFNNKFEDSSNNENKYVKVSSPINRLL